MNYDKKRKRQNGRQDCKPSERTRIYMQGYFDGQAKLISKLVEDKILPPITYDMKSITKEEFIHEFEQKPCPACATLNCAGGKECPGFETWCRTIEAAS